MALKMSQLHRHNHIPKKTTPLSLSVLPTAFMGVCHTAGGNTCIWVNTITCMRIPKIWLFITFQEEKMETTCAMSETTLDGDSVRTSLKYSVCYNDENAISSKSTKTL